MATSLFKRQYSGEPIGFRLHVPGLEVPEWFSYKTEGSSLKIIKQLPHCSRNSQFWGLAFCVVGAYDIGDLYKERGIRCECHFMAEGGLQNNPCFSKKSFRLLESEHVHIWYDWSIQSNNHSFNEAAFNFYSVFEEFRVLKCGVHLLSAQDDDKQPTFKD